jgi:hypothetical protein
MESPAGSQPAVSIAQLLADLPPDPPGLEPPGYRPIPPPMIGDLAYRLSLRQATAPVVASIGDLNSPNTGVFTVPAQLTANVHVPIVNAGPFKIADNESPRPVDRAFVSFSFFYSLGTLADVPGGPIAGPIPTAPAFSGFGSPTPDSVLHGGGQVNLANLAKLATSPFPGQYSHYLQAVLRQGDFILQNPPPNVATAATLLKNALADKSNFLTAKNIAILAANSTDPQFQALISGTFAQGGVTSVPATFLQLQGGTQFAGSNGHTLRLGQTNLYQESFGFEKTFLDGNASLGLRAPIFQLQGDGSVAQSDFGDLSVVLKYAVLNDSGSGNLVSTGLVVTLPTGPDTLLLTDGSALHPTLLQPFVGGIYNGDRFYLHGFSSLVIPTDQRDAIFWCNDLGVGYDVWRCPCAALTQFTPTLEMHVNTPLTHRGFRSEPVGALDSVIFTGGAHFTFCDRMRLTVGIGAPLTGPLPFELDVFTRLNFLF